MEQTIIIKVALALIDDMTSFEKSNFPIDAVTIEQFVKTGVLFDHSERVKQFGYVRRLPERNPVKDSLQILIRACDEVEKRATFSKRSKVAKQKEVVKKENKAPEKVPKRRRLSCQEETIPFLCGPETPIRKKRTETKKRRRTTFNTPVLKLEG